MDGSKSKNALEFTEPDREVTATFFATERPPVLKAGSEFAPRDHGEELLYANQKYEEVKAATNDGILSASRESTLREKMVNLAVATALGLNMVNPYYEPGDTTVQSPVKLEQAEVHASKAAETKNEVSATAPEVPSPKPTATATPAGAPTPEVQAVVAPDAPLPTPTPTAST